MVGDVSEDVVDLLLEIPSGLRFTDMQIYGAREHLLSAVRLAEACGKTLVKLLYRATSDGKSRPSSSPVGSSLQNADADPISQCRWRDF